MPNYRNNLKYKLLNVDEEEALKTAIEMIESGLGE